MTLFGNQVKSIDKFTKLGHFSKNRMKMSTSPQAHSKVPDIDKIIMFGVLGGAGYSMYMFKRSLETEHQ